MDMNDKDQRVVAGVREFLGEASQDFSDYEILTKPSFRRFRKYVCADLVVEDFVNSVGVGLSMAAKCVWNVFASLGLKK